MSATASNRRCNAVWRKVQRINMVDRAKFREGWERIWGHRGVLAGDESPAPAAAVPERIESNACPETGKITRHMFRAKFGAVRILEESPSKASDPSREDYDPLEVLRNGAEADKLRVKNTGLASARPEA